MNAKIRPIDMKPGMFVMVCRWHDEPDYDQPMPTKREEGYFGAEREIEVKRKGVGDPVRVLALAIPFATIEICANKQRGVIDTRLCDYIQVDKAYVRSLVPDYFRKPKKLSSEAEAKINGRRIHRYIPGEGWKELIKEQK